MPIMLVIEIVAGLAAVIVTAMAFTNLAWAEGAPAQSMKRESLARTKRLLVLAGVLWLVAVVCFAYMR